MNKMAKKSHVVSILSAICVSLLFVFSPMSSADLKSPKLIQKVQIRGGVVISIRPDRSLLSPNLVLKRGGELLRNQRVKINNIEIPEVSPGRYRKQITGFTPIPGRSIKLRINLTPVLHQERIVKPDPITGSAEIGQLFEFTSPAPSALINLSKTNTLLVKWTRYLRDVNLTIVELVGMSATDSTIIYTKRLSGKSLSIPTSILKPKKQYGIYLMYKMGKFSLSGPYTGDSRLALNLSVATYFSTL